MYCMFVWFRKILISRILARPEDCAICEPSQTPSVPVPFARPKYPISTDPSYHRQAHPRSPKRAHRRPSYSSAHLEENGHEKGHQEDANWGRRCDQAWEHFQQYRRSWGQTGQQHTRTVGTYGENWYHWIDIKKVNIGIDSKFVVIPRIVQIPAKKNHILNRVDLGWSANYGKRCRIRDTTRITLANPLDNQC